MVIFFIRHDLFLILLLFLVVFYVYDLLRHIAKLLSDLWWKCINLFHICQIRSYQIVLTAKRLQFLGSFRHLFQTCLHIALSLLLIVHIHIITSESFRFFLWIVFDLYCFLFLSFQLIGNIP